MTTDSISVWGLNPSQLHDRFWASRGVQVVRQGEPSQIVDGAEMYLLIDARSMALFSLAKPIETFCWRKPLILYVRLKDCRESDYSERAVVGSDNRFIRFERLYGGTSESRLARVALTCHRDIAQLWQQSAAPGQAWRSLRRHVGRRQREVLSIAGNIYEASNEGNLVAFGRRLAQLWRRPDSTINRPRESQTPGIWIDPDSTVPRGSQIMGPVWIGAGREIDPARSIVGPCILWDDPRSRPAPETLRWEQIEPVISPDYVVRPRKLSSLGRGGKRIFDVVFSLLVLLATLPLYPLIIAAIWLEDRGPIFFTHRRQTLGGREFPCIKFRSMRVDADQMKQQLLQQNLADGPQFYMAADPRLTRVGRLLRSWNLDELPQFINVLLGHMSVVGPRPSPHSENQFCPGWREARLSVRPGITGLWQVMRTRRAGTDFQEWIKYDIRYVENAGMRLDLWIIGQTIRLLLVGPSTQHQEDAAQSTPVPQA
ncbi:MAG TPA: sugar transferase [Tepidisphaeraceae bacterium]|jgi:lipopolysaccharide/colanic/teichoic acid biosynthesis glycosyltransferase